MAEPDTIITEDASRERLASYFDEDGQFMAALLMVDVVVMTHASRKTQKDAVLLLMEAFRKSEVVWLQNEGSGKPN